MFFFLLFFAIDGAVQLLLLTGIRLGDLIDGWRVLRVGDDDLLKRSQLFRVTHTVIAFKSMKCA